MICPVCGLKGAACHGSVPVRLTADQLVDIGLKPEDIKPGGTIVMADQSEPKARYPKQEVNEGQEHGYIGDVEVYDPAAQEAGHTNAKTTHKSAEDSAPEEKPIVGATGLVGGPVDTVDNVKAPKK